MAKYLTSLNGSRGRRIIIYDRKCEIITNVTVGSVLTNNATDGSKTIYYKDVVGLQYKRAGLALGYLQFETSSGQMNNISSNMFAENTFTFDGSGNATNMHMDEIYSYLSDVIEGYKYNDEVLINTPFPSHLVFDDTTDLERVQQAKRERDSKEIEERKQRQEEIEGKVEEIAERDELSSFEKSLLKLISKHDDISTMGIMKMMPRNIAPADVTAALQSLQAKNVIFENESGSYSLTNNV